MKKKKISRRGRDESKSSKSEKMIIYGSVDSELAQSLRPKERQQVFEK